MEDKAGTLWLGTNSGLGRFDPKTKESRLYTKEDGLQGSLFYALNGITTSDGRMWFGGPKGMISFLPSAITDNPHVPEVRLTSLKQGGEDVDFGAAPERLTAITLDGSSNFFEFEFVALDYTNPKQNKYGYKLEGFDSQWYEAGKHNFGRYAGLPPGEYELQLKGSN